MTFSTKPLFKGFGAAADVAGQIATDKAVNSRRVRSDFFQFDITQGQLIEDAMTDANGNVPHGLGKIPKGAVILKSTADCHVSAVTSSTVTINPSGLTVTLWVV